MTIQFCYKRRELITLALSVATVPVWSLGARAQPQAGMPVIGFLDTTGLLRWFDAFQEGLKELGYAPGQTIAIERRVGAPAQLSDLAAELVRLQPKVIVASGSRAAVAAKNATKTIPIVLAFATDPVELGLVASLAQPGGNITGQSNQGPGLVGKRMQLLAEIVPGVSRVGVLAEASANQVDFREIQAAAVSLGLALDSFDVASPEDLDAGFRQAAAAQSGGVAVLSGPLVFRHRDLVVAAAARHRIPAIYFDEEYAAAGGLISYGPSVTGLHHSAATFVDKILKGARPADLPVEQPTRFKLVINLQTAKALGLSVPPSLLARADAVIE